MCQNSKKKYAALIKKQGHDPIEAQKMNIIFDEFQEVNKSVADLREEVKKDIAELKEELKKSAIRSKGFNERLTSVEKNTTESQRLAVETHATVNRLYQRWDENNAERDAAVMSFARSIIQTKAGKIFAFLFLGFFGLALAYIVEHLPQLLTSLT